MTKKILLIIFTTIILTGCENKEELQKNEYIAMKTNLLEKENYTAKEDLPLDITTKIDRKDENITYKIILTNPKENMKNVKVMAIHNYYNDGTFPSIGIFDDKVELLKTDNNPKVELEDTIKTTKDIQELNLDIKVWIEYTNDVGLTKEIYYKAT